MEEITQSEGKILIGDFPLIAWIQVGTIEIQISATWRSQVILQEVQNFERSTQPSFTKQFSKNYAIIKW
jgi:hypothetical protein